MYLLSIDGAVQDYTIKRAVSLLISIILKRIGNEDMQSYIGLYVKVRHRG